MLFLIAPVTDKLRSNRLTWYEIHIPSRMLSMRIDGCRIRGRPKKIWIDCGGNNEMTAHRVEDVLPTLPR